MHARPDQHLTDPEQSYLDAIDGAVADVAEIFGREPASFLFEADLRAVLFTRLFDSLAKRPLRLTITDPRRAPLSGLSLSMNPVKGECDARLGRRFDVAILAPKPHIETDLPWILPVCAAIEIKFWQAGERQPDLASDIEKLDAYAADATGPFTGLALLFSQRPCDPQAFGDPRVQLLTKKTRFRLRPRQVSACVVVTDLAAG